MPEDIHKKPFDEATITKLEIFERYLEEWLAVFIHAPAFDNVLICDFFAGPGYDTQGCPGSPLRILRTVEKFCQAIVEKGVSIRLVLNERNRSKAAQLESLLTSKADEIQQRFANLVSLKCYGEDFLRLFNELYPEFGNQPNLIFIDQSGIKQVSAPVFQQLVALNATDFLFFISSSYFRRFAEEAGFQNNFPDLDVNMLRKSRFEDAHRMILDYYRGKIPADNDTRLYPFSLKKSSNIYGLIFGSKHPLGVEKFLKIAWDKSKLNGEANFDIDQDIEKQQPTLFDHDPTFRRLTKVQLFEQELERYIQDRREVTNREVYDFTLARGHLPKQARYAIMKLRKAGKIDCDRQIGCSYDSCCKNRNTKIIKAVDSG